ncbi:gliding motility lipoprotein GldD [Marinilabiliaceae bacterium ANBcel2]|nr:gliding motility lipoprotein GldD [Marinilabiliaceae bacterium ANBcel2]
MYKAVLNLLFVIGAILFFLNSCGTPGSPKPRGYFRIDLPQKEYKNLDYLMPYSFDYPVYGELETDVSRDAEPYWMNLFFPQFEARVHISYKPVEDNLYDLYEDNIRFAYNHAVKADAIEEHYFQDKENDVYGMLFEIKGNAASPLQFFATDSTNHFLRGSLYFQTQPNRDSLAPVIDFLTIDMIRLMETIRWNEN